MLDTPETMIRIILVDFSKAFDRVDHHTLLTKCTSLGLPNFIIKWLTSFLRQRKQRIKIGNVKSDVTTINAGVPQRAISGPIGFIHHINDLQTSCGYVKYVDDCTIWEKCSRCGHNGSLQTAATEVAQWTTTNKMALNYKIRRSICFKRSPLHIPQLTINDKPIEQVNSTRLLGDALTADLKWQSHIDEITAKASQRLYFKILLNRAGVESQHLVNIYTSLVRSVVEYTCQVWITCLTKHQTKQLESIQRRAMRIIFRNVSYAEAIVTEGIPTLADRRESQLWRTGGNPNSGGPEGIPTLADRRESQLWRTGGNPNSGGPEGIPTLADRRESQLWRTGGNPNSGGPEGIPTLADRRESQLWRTGGNPNSGGPEGIPTLADRRESQLWRTGGNPNSGGPEGIPTLADRRETLCRTLFANMKKHNHKLNHLLHPIRELCLDAELIDLRTL